MSEADHIRAALTEVIRTIADLADTSRAIAAAAGLTVEKLEEIALVIADQIDHLAARD